MHEEEPSREQTVEGRPAHQVRLPGFIVDEPIGLGDVIKLRHVRGRHQTVRRLRATCGRIESMDGFRTIVRTLTESRGLRRPERLLPQGSGLQLWAG